jgi:subtilase family serine protease
MARIRNLSRRIRPIRRILPAAAATAALAAFGLAPPALAAPAASGSRVPITSESGLVPAGAVDEGTAAFTGNLAIRVYLSGRDPAGLQALAQQVSTPGDPQYQHFLTPAQYAATFGPTPQQSTAVGSWLKACGLTVTSADAHYVGASGSPAAVQCAVGAPMHLFSLHGVSLRAPAGPLTVPQDVSGDVLSISGLSSLTPTVHPASAQPVPVAAASSATCSAYFGANPATTLPLAYGATQPWQACGYLPSQLRSAYGVTSTGLTGEGVKIAVVDAYASATLASDTQQYATQNGGTSWAPGQLTQQVPAGLAAQPLAWTEEETMDVEAAHAMAPGADVVYVAAAGTQDSNFVDAISQIVDEHLASIVSGSWVIGADTGVPTATVLAFEHDFLQGTVEGIGFVFASGDTGSQAASQDGNGPYETATAYPASDPLVTAVGGTSLAVGSSGQYEWETGWETDYASLSADGSSWVGLPGSFAGGAGGGPSARFGRPWYQLGTVPSGFGNHRVVPDVAMDADPVTGMLVGQSFALPSGNVYVQYASGGTSLAAPLFTGIEALAEQHAGHPLGFANPAIYRAAAAGAFRAVTDTPPGVTTPLAAAHTVTSVSSTGTISTSFVLATFGRAQDAGLSVTAGYDDVTGVGTPTSRYLDYFR